MEKESRQYEDKAAEVTEAPGEGQGWEEATSDEGAAPDQSARADK
jgi:hypothetical protein